MSLTTVTVTGKWRLPDATIPEGTVKFTPSPVFQNSGDDVFVTESVTATLDAQGAISVDLYATDDDDTSPENAQYTVTERIAGATRIYNVEIPNANPTVDLADLAATTTPSTVGYALTSHDHDFARAEAGAVAPVAGSYIQAGVGYRTGSLVMLANRAYVYRFTLSEDATLDRAGVGINSAGDGSSVIRLAIANWNGGNPAGASLVGGSELGSLVATSATDMELTGLALSLTKGTYWMAIATNGHSATTPTVDGFQPVDPIVASSLATVTGAGSSLVTSSATVTGAIPDPLPALANGLAGAAPLVALKFS